MRRSPTRGLSAIAIELELHGESEADVGSK